MDTSAFIAGFDPLSIRDAQYTVPAVRNELASHSLSLTRLNAAVEGGKLEVREPNPEYVKKIETSSMAVGDLRFLSDADLQVLALALELKEKGYSPHIVTDDYSIQNVANQLGIQFAPLMTFGIRYRFRWILYCPACHRKYAPNHRSKRCGVCGTELRRKPAGKTLV